MTETNSQLQVEVPQEYQHSFSWADLVKQVRLDLFAKGVQTGYSTTYSWLADQFGHFALGYILTAESRFFSHDDAFWTLLISSVGLGAFAVLEGLDYRAAAKDAAAAGLFPLRRADVIKDAGTAVWYFFSGMVIAAQTLVPGAWGVAVTILALFVNLLIARWWLSRKMCFQRADLPFILRLSDLRLTVARPARSVAINGITRFASLNGPWKHLLIVGSLQSGKTSLVCAVGTEHTFQLGPARYLTYLAFRQIAQSGQDALSSKTRELWPWDKSNIVILDDIDLRAVGAARREHRELIDELRQLPNIDRLKKCRTIWVLSDPSQEEAWRLAISHVLETDQIGIVELSSHTRK
jgi:hypothetical protein